MVVVLGVAVVLAVAVLVDSVAVAAVQEEVFKKEER